MDARLIGLALLPLLAVAAMWRLGALSDPHARAWHAISGVRAVVNGNRLTSVRFGALAWLALRLDLPLQLKRAGVRQSPSRFILHSAEDHRCIDGAVQDEPRR